MKNLNFHHKGFHFKIILFIGLMFCVTINNYAQSGFCYTSSSGYPVGVPPVENRSSSSCYPDYPGSYYIKIYFHVVHDGPDGMLTAQEVQSAYDRLMGDYSPLNIFFVWDCYINYINNHEYYVRPLQVGGNPPHENFEEYTSIYGHSDGIDLFLFGPDSGQGEIGLTYDSGAGLSNDTPGNALAVVGFQNSYFHPNQVEIPLYNSSVLSHEMGHCLGLYHTYGVSSGPQCTPSSGFPDEYANGDGCCDCRDLVCDTQFEPGQGMCTFFGFPPPTNCTEDDCQIDCATCDYTPLTIPNDPAGNPYWPPLPTGKNIMTVSHVQCATEFTVGQGERARYMIESQGILQMVSMPPPEIVIESETNSVFCVDESIQIQYTICPPEDCPSINSVEVELTPSVPPSQLPHITYSGAFTGGSASVTVGPNDLCATITLDISASSGFPVDENLSVTMEAVPEDLDCPKYLTGIATTETTLFDCSSCSCPVGGILIGGSGSPNSLSQYVGPNGPLPANPTASLNLTIVGTLILDATTFDVAGYYNFPEGSQICMAPGAEILIPANNELEVFGGTHIKGCGERWKSITLQGDKASLKLTGGTSPVRVEDAQFAVHPGSETHVAIQNTVFDKNFVGLFFDDGANGDFFLNELSSTTFDCTGNLLAHYDPSDPNDGTISFAGIQVQGLSLLHVGLNGAVNSFNNMRHGILGEASNMKVQNATFSNLGIGIRSVGDGHYVATTGGFPSNTFTGCGTGVSARGVFCYINRNQMTGMGTGILAEDAIDYSVIAQYNEISANSFGIRLLRNDGAYVNVRDNTINLVAPPPGQPSLFTSEAITVEELGLGHRSAGITYNTCNLFSGTGGIMLRTVAGYELSCNNVNVSDAEPGYIGIALENCSGIEMDVNHVHDLGTGLTSTGHEHHRHNGRAVRQYQGQRYKDRPAV